ncbi:MAG TPA: hypothetical protein VKB93_10120 [Thermoanaerobaculia bacterium]|nr:hypothetical protein [Thermoanaerobaculia bacterium]
MVIELPAPAANVLVDLIVGNQIVVEALGAGGVIASNSFLAGTGPTAAIFGTANPEILRIRMADSGTEDRITLVFSS